MNTASPYLGTVTHKYQAGRTTAPYYETWNETNQCLEIIILAPVVGGFELMTVCELAIRHTRALAEWNTYGIRYEPVLITHTPPAADIVARAAEHDIAIIVLSEQEYAAWQP